MGAPPCALTPAKSQGGDSTCASPVGMKDHPTYMKSHNRMERITSDVLKCKYSKPSEIKRLRSTFFQY